MRPHCGGSVSHFPGPSKSEPRRHSDHTTFPLRQGPGHSKRSHYKQGPISKPSTPGQLQISRTRNAARVRSTHCAGALPLASVPRSPGNSVHKCFPRGARRASAKLVSLDSRQGEGWESRRHSRSPRWASVWFGEEHFCTGICSAARGSKQGVFHDSRGVSGFLPCRGGEKLLFWNMSTEEALSSPSSPKPAGEQVSPTSGIAPQRAWKLHNRCEYSALP